MNATKIAAIITSSILLWHAASPASNLSNLKEHGDISELDRYVLQHYVEDEIDLDDSLRACTVEHLPLDILFKRAQEEMDQLQATIEKSTTTFLIDETLRWQVWNLAQTAAILQAMIGDSIDPSLQFLQELKAQAEETVCAGLIIHEALEARISNVLQEEQLIPEVEDFVNLTREGVISQYAEQFEKEFEVTKWNKAHDACGSTGRAILYHFNRKYFKQRELGYALEHPIIGIDNLLKEIENNKGSRANFLYLVETDKFDHVFMIHQTPTGRYRIYQSYVGEYSLRAAMAEQYMQSGGVPHLTYDALYDYLRDFDVLTRAQKVTRGVAQLHQKLFHILPPESLRQHFAEGDSYLKTITLEFAD